MNILIIGSKGQLAKELKNTLRSNQIKFIFCGKDKVDVTLYKSIIVKIDKYRPSVIINCAAYTDVDNSETKKNLAYKLNCHAIENLVKICKLKKIYLIHFSTDYIFSGKKGNYKETDRANPVNYYGKTKKISEKIIKDNLKLYVIFRISWLIGKYSNNFLKKIIYSLKNKKKIFMVNNQISNPTTTIFVSEIIKICCENYFFKKNVLTGVFHLANEPAISKFKFTTFIYNKLKKLNLTKNDCKIIKISIKKFKSKARRPLDTSFDLSKIKKKINSKNFNWKNILVKNLHNL